MGIKTTKHKSYILFLFIGIMLLGASCNTTRQVPEGQYLLRKTSIVFKSSHKISRKSEIKDNLARIQAQKPNTRFLGIVPLKLLLYNSRRKKYRDDTTNFQLRSKTVEKPVIFDTSMLRRSAQDMKSYMYNQGYFYARITDTFKYKKRKAYVTFKVMPGKNYLVDKVNYTADDSLVAKIANNAAAETGLKSKKEFTMSMLEEERSRITTLLRDHGYYRFAQDNVTFVLDTVNKAMFRDVENPFEGAADFIKHQQDNKDPTVTINVVISITDDSAVYTRYTVKSVRVFPDFLNNADLHNTDVLIHKQQHDIDFFYHKYYINSNVLYQHMYLLPGKEYTQSDYDKTITKLNELGIFQYIRIVFHEDTANNNMLNCVIEMDRTKKHDFSLNLEVSNGSTYTLGVSPSVSYRDRNFAHGANLFTATINFGLETIYDDNLGTGFFNDFYIITRYYGFNTSLDIPKFLAPLPASLFNNSSLPHTIFSFGYNLMDRNITGITTNIDSLQSASADYFTLINTSASFAYNWHQSQTVTWSLSPAFINIIRLPRESAAFQRELDSNEFLKNTYKQTFIEGENLTFTYSDLEKKRGKNYSFVKLGIEESGALLSAVNSLGTALNNLYNINYSQYTKFDFDTRHYFTFPNSTIAVRFVGGVGFPYGQSQTLPYIKQYFVGGPYSLRGWRIRTLGPGSYYNPADQNNINVIDRTGDIKLEWNGEYRFFIANIVAGAAKLNGALFTDAGNIWLTHADPSYPGGDFQFSTLGQDIAADMGAGIRVDIASFLTLRMDVAMPIKKPYVFTNGGFVFNQIDFNNPTWRANNIIFNLSIGYPF
ncbi:MAG: BamA/TamA family outer membrane protein [Flavipsychrobacter sp.]|nr:BamA/TamA family outer membrane protein [Flavipsychrobacter sp.]